jgi:hypothetical protein
MRLLLDMNLSPDLCRSLAALGHEAVHWSNVGEPTAADEVVMTYARDHGFVVVSHDLDFSAMLAQRMRGNRALSNFDHRTSWERPSWLFCQPRCAHSNANSQPAP